MHIDVNGTEGRVCQDIARRQAKGLEKYGIGVQENPLPLRAWLEHAYLETLDKAIYLKRAMEEMDNKSGGATGIPVIDEMASVLKRHGILK